MTEQLDQNSAAPDDAVASPESSDVRELPDALAVVDVEVVRVIHLLEAVHEARQDAYHAILSWYVPDDPWAGRPVGELARMLAAALLRLAELATAGPSAGYDLTRAASAARYTARRIAGQHQTITDSDAAVAALRTAGFGAAGPFDAGMTDAELHRVVGVVLEAQAPRQPIIWSRQAEHERD
jgi:hypothetical protein